MTDLMHAVATRDEWYAALAGLPSADLLQSWEWGEFKSRHGWTPYRWAWKRERQVLAAAQMLLRSETRFGMRVTIAYVPRGPLLDWTDFDLRRRVLHDLRSLACRYGALFLKMDPHVAVGYGVPGSPEEQPDALGLKLADDLVSEGWRESWQQIQFRNTVVLNLAQDESVLLASFRQKTRYNVRLAMRKGVTVRVGTDDDLEMLFRLYACTAERDGFVIRPQQYYRDAWGCFMRDHMAEPLLAEVGGEVVAALLLFTFCGRATYMYGMSSGAHSEKMPNYLLQWEAIRRAKTAGCSIYDFWGAPDRFVSGDPLWGVWRFKAGFRGQVVRTLGAWDYPCRRAGYWLYARAMPRWLAMILSMGQ
ncbi:MAG: peptidoglycan bridge formation glycyltransferase FemA/FemB family protein [Anaerolineales bacterium]|nr:peptidoglycan bridge formation glycyltransferase FemA/FemB family protein [Anaerolineales bacterium]